MKNKILKILILVLSIFLFSSCEMVKNNDYTGEHYTISYIYRNELLDIGSNEYQYGEEVILPIPNIKGFDGWFFTKDYSGERVKKINSTDYGNKILYAKIDESKVVFNISYYCDDKLLNLEPSSYKKGSSFSLPIPSVIDNYEFVGWYTENSFINKVDAINNTDEEDKIFYAKYEKIVFSINYYNGEEKISLNPACYSIGSNFKLPRLDSNDFEGWYKEKELINRIEYINEFDKEDLNLYASFYKDNIKRATDVMVFRDCIKEINSGNGLPLALPSTGKVNALIVPVDFSDYPASNDLNDKIDKAFFGTSEDTGWESLSSYYYKSSYGLLEITGVISDVFHTNQKSSYYSRKDEDDAVNEIIDKALVEVDKKIDFNDFDINNDGYVDAIYFIYTAPVDFDGYVSDLWWAYCDQFRNVENSYDGKHVNYYMFAGSDFFDETPSNGKNIKINAETFIHESGHLLGLDDYYDYDTTDRYNKGGIGGADMMDYNVGDHNPYSKCILGWINPQLINVNDNWNGYNIYLNKFSSTGDALIIAKSDIKSYYDEYFIIDYYTPDGLNEFASGYHGLFSTSGVRIYHVSASLTTDNIDCMWDITKYNNANTKYKLIKLVEADGKNDIDKEKESTNSDLFNEGSVCNNLRWNDGSSLNITINVISVGDNVKIHIEKNY